MVLGGVADTPGGHTVLQRDFHRLEKGASSVKGKAWSCPWGRVTPGHAKGQLAGKELGREGVLVDKQLTMRQIYTLTTEAASSILC